MEGTRVSGQGVCFLGGRFWQLAIFAATGTLGVTSQAEAAIYYYRQDSALGVVQPAPKAQTQRAKVSRHGDKKSDGAVEKESKPQGPLIISISIAQQKLRIYDANGLFAEAPVSTGMPGHPTPMGVFSVIQKQKLHHSNIYSGAPMPFMQRITWSGIAIHAGVLPGHPASHGCIRMPAAFAVKMYNWTKMGARVIVTPGDVTPASFSHPLLAAVKVVPQPVAVEETKADVVAVRTPEKPVQVGADAAETKIELRPTVGHIDEMKSAADESRRHSPSLQVKTADASGALPAALSASGSEPAPQPTEATVSEEASKVAPEVDAPKSEIDPNAAKHGEVASSDEKPAGEKSAETQPEKIADGGGKPVETAGDQPSKPEAATATSEATRRGDTTAEAAAGAPPTEAKMKTDAEGPGERPAKAMTSAPAALPVATNEMPLKADLKSDFVKAAARPTPSFTFKKAGQIAVFVSRKDSKLYIRQDFAPLFELPVTIAADARPLGTHIFTAQIDNNDANVLHWSVVSLPTPSKSAERRTDEERSSRGRKFASAGPIEAKPLPVPDSPAEALDRLNLPAEVMAKIYEAVSTGGSIIVSDQGIAAGETGEGTDFIVSLR
jgi:lipoprotein-anchoring transpeptidase ErfK/SrfK